MHANFVNHDEMHADFKSFYAKLWPIEFQKMMQKFSGASTPVTYLISAHCCNFSLRCSSSNAEYDEPFYPLATIVEDSGGFDNIMKGIESESWMKKVNNVLQ